MPSLLAPLNRLYHRLFVSDEAKGIIQTIVACFWFALMAILIRYLSESLPPLLLVFLRNCAAVIVLMPWAYRHKQLWQAKIRRPDLILSRALTGVMGMMLFFYALALMPTAQVTALSFTVPLTSTLLAVFFLKEKVSIHFWLALLVGFCGVLLIVKPSAEGFDYNSLFVLSATTFWAFSNVLVKKLTTEYKPIHIVFMMMCFMTVLSLPAALWVWQGISVMQLVLIFVLGFSTVQGQIAITKAYSYTDIKIVMPFDFFRLLFVSIMAYFFFGETLKLSTLSGAILIVLSSLYVAYKVSGKGSIIRNIRNKMINRI